jgi:hypothetical protein
VGRSHHVTEPTLFLKGLSLGGPSPPVRRLAGRGLMDDGRYTAHGSCRRRVLRSNSWNKRVASCSASSSTLSGRFLLTTGRSLLFPGRLNWYKLISIRRLYLDDFSIAGEHKRRARTNCRLKSDLEAFFVSLQDVFAQAFTHSLSPAFFPK